MSSKHGNLWLEREDFGDVTVVRLKLPNNLDEDLIRDNFATIYTLVDVGRNQIVLNLAGVGYLPSMGLGKLVMLNRKIQATNGQLVLCQLSAPVEEVLNITNIYQLMDVVGSETEALAKLGTPAK